jgi:hypothetical protein
MKKNIDEDELSGNGAGFPQAAALGVLAAENSAEAKELFFEE